MALLLLPASFAAGWLVTWLSAAIALRRLRKADGLPWTERARRAFAARHAVKRSALVPGMVVGVLIVWDAFVWPEARWGARLWGGLCGLTWLYGVVLVGERLERRLCRASRDLPGPGLALSWILVLAALLPLLLMIVLIPRRWGWEAAAVLALGAALVTVVNLGGWLVLLRKAGLVGPASERLEAIVARAADRVGVRPRATYELVSPHANALALPVTQSLVFTAPILAVLDDDELTAVAAHELGHLNEPRAALWTRLAASYLVVGVAAALPLGGSYGLWAAVAPLAVLFAGSWLLRKVGRRMEERSDRLGLAHEGETAGTYARALEKLYEANLVPAVLRGKQVHPHLYDRMVAAGITPSYDRPAPPRVDLLAALPLLTLIVALTVAFVVAVSDRSLRAGAGGSAPGGGPRFVRRPVVEALARARRSFQEGRLDEAEAALEEVEGILDLEPNEVAEERLRVFRNLIRSRRELEARVQAESEAPPDP